MTYRRYAIVAVITWVLVTLEVPTVGVWWATGRLTGHPVSTSTITPKGP